MYLPIQGWKNIVKLFRKGVKRMRKIFKALIVSILCASVFSMSVFASSDNIIDSKGLLYLENEKEPSNSVIFHSGDLTKMNTIVLNGLNSLIKEINKYPRQSMDLNADFGELTKALSVITEIPEDTYYYDRSTNGSTCARYIKSGTDYYLCNENGVKTGSLPLSNSFTTISIVEKNHATVPASGEVQLVECMPVTENYLSAGTAAIINKTLYLGNGADDENFYNKGYAEGFKSAQSSGKLTYKYHSHTGTATAGGGCYGTPIYHVHNGYSCYKPCGGELSDTKFVYLTNGSKWEVKVCQTCGGWTNANSGDTVCSQRTATLTCGKTEDTIEKYGLNCGKTVETIESATITFS